MVGTVATVYAQSIDPTLPATSDALRWTVREPALVVSAGAEAVGDAGPDVASVTVAVDDRARLVQREARRGGRTREHGRRGVHAERRAHRRADMARRIGARGMQSVLSRGANRGATTRERAARRELGERRRRDCRIRGRSGVRRRDSQTTVSGRDGRPMTGERDQPAAPFGVGGLSDTVAVGAVLSMRKVAFTGTPALPAASMLAAYSAVRPWVATGDPRRRRTGSPRAIRRTSPAGPQGRARSGFRRVPPGPSSADTATVTGDTYQPPPPFGRGRGGSRRPSSVA